MHRAPSGLRRAHRRPNALKTPAKGGLANGKYEYARAVLRVDVLCVIRGPRGRLQPPWVVLGSIQRSHRSPLCVVGVGRLRRLRRLAEYRLQGSVLPGFVLATFDDSIEIWKQACVMLMTAFEGEQLHDLPVGHGFAIYATASHRVISVNHRDYSRQ